MSEPPAGPADRREDLFHRAAELPPGERAAFLDRECGADRALRADLVSLLRELDQHTPLYLQPLGDRARIAPLPDRIGRYRILGVIGEGGMGVVYLAEQVEPVRRTVALKVVKAGLDTARVLARFSLERQALALMDHPNIAKIHDAGATEEGRPYYVMEHVPGAPVTDYCDGERLDVAARCALFAQVCDAVQHAHQRGVIHRDLKPSNVLVTVHDGVAVPKVIDFGIARPATQHGDGDLELRTRSDEIIGTLEYMSPEQAQGGGDVDTRSDIYSLGVLLYQLLTGTLPFASLSLQRKPIAEARAILRDREPARPSTQSGAHLPGVSRETLRRSLHGDLDWIVMQAIAKDRELRYASASELASDLRRYLAHEPVLASPPGAGYRLRKFVRRNRLAVGAAALVVLALGAGLAMAMLGMRRAQSAQQRADARADELRRRLYANAILLAQQALENADATTAGSQLASCPPDLRGFEWDLLQRLLARGQPVLPDPGGWNMRCCALHGDGVRFVVGYGGAVCVVDPRDGSRGEPIPVLEGTILTLVRPRASSRILAGDDTGAFVVIDAASLARERVVATPQDRVRAAALSPSGGHVALLDADQRVTVLDLEQGTRTPLAAAPAPASFDVLAFAADGGRLAAGGSDLCVWDCRTGERLRLVAEPRVHWRPDENPGLHSRVSALAWSHDGQRLAVGVGRDAGVYTKKPAVVDIRAAGTLELERTLGGHGIGVVSALEFAPDDLSLAAGGSDGFLTVTDVSHGWAQTQAVGHTGKIGGLFFRGPVTGGEAPELVSAAPDNVRVWKWPIAQCPDSAFTWPSYEAAVWSPDRTRLAFRSWRFGGVLVLDSDTFELLCGMRATGGSPTPLAFLRDGARLATAEPGGGVAVRRLADGEIVVRLSGAPPSPVAAACSVDGATLFVVGAAGEVVALDLAGAAPARTLRAAGGTARALAVAPGGAWLVVGFADGAIERLPLRSASAPAPMRAESGVRRLVVSGDGRWIVAATDRLAVEVFAAATGERVRALGDAATQIHEVDASADGRRLVTLDAGRAQIWDLESGVQLVRVLTSSAFEMNVAFRADGRGIRTAGYRAKAWDVDADPVTSERRAAVRIAYDAYSRLCERHLVAAEILRHADDEGLPAPARAILEQLVRTIGDSRVDLNEYAWGIAIRAFETPATYRRALTAVSRAAELAPESAAIANTLATVCYRAGEYLRAAEITERLIAAAGSSGPGASPFDLAIRAMALHRLGRRDDGARVLEQLRAHAARSGAAMDVQAIGFLREAEELFQSR